jgi:hypothetical protein
MAESFWQKLVAAQCRTAPNAVDVTDVRGSCTRGPRDDSELPTDDGLGLTKLHGLVSVEIPTHHLPALAIDEAVTVTDDARVTTRYKVRDIRKKDDGLTRILFLVAA